MKSLIHLWGIVLVVVFSIIGIFLLPFVCWLFNGSAGYLLPFVLSIITILISIIWILMRKRGEILFKFVMLYFSLALFVPSLITGVRFEFGNLDSINDCILIRAYPHHGVYNKFGIYKFNPGSHVDLKVVRNINGEMCMYTYYYGSHQYHDVYVYDSYGNYIESIHHTPNNDYMIELRQHGYQ